MCTEQIMKSIKEICQKNLINGKTHQEEIEIPISSIISKVKNRYGFHLPYLLSKKSSKIKNISLENLFDRNYNTIKIIKVKISDYL